MAFYAYNAARPAPQPITLLDQDKEPLRVDGVGAYYAYDATHEAVQPINGLAGALGPSAELADEAARAILGRRRPIMVASEWAEAITDIEWKQAPSSTELTLIAMSDEELRAVARAAFGHGLPVVGILAARPSSLEYARAAFRATPYDFHQLLAVASIGDRRPLPQAFFLYVAGQRGPEDRDGGNGLLAQTGAALGGKLVHIISLATKCMPTPKPPIQVALRTQFSGKRPVRPVVPDAPPLPPTPAVVRPQAAPAPAPIAASGLGVSDTTLVLGASLAVLGLGYLLKDKL